MMIIQLEFIKYNKWKKKYIDNNKYNNKKRNY